MWYLKRTDRQLFPWRDIFTLQNVLHICDLHTKLAYLIDKEIPTSKIQPVWKVCLSLSVAQNSTQRATEWVLMKLCRCVNKNDPSSIHHYAQNFLLKFILYSCIILKNSEHWKVPKNTYKTRYTEIKLKQISHFQMNSLWENFGIFFL